MCTCNAQLQPHDPMPRVCPPREEHDRELDEIRETHLHRILAGQDDHPYADELTLGGQG